MQTLRRPGTLDCATCTATTFPPSAKRSPKAGRRPELITCRMAGEPDRFDHESAATYSPTIVGVSVPSGATAAHCASC
jgi:hypothetical protein